MERRQFLFNATALMFNGCLVGVAKNSIAQTSSGLDVVAEIKKLRIPSGPYTGGYETAPDGGMNWYFANLGLLPVIQYLSPSDLSTYTLGYLNLYLRNLESNSSIKDVDFPYGRRSTDIFTLVPADSDDAYAGTFLSLVARYLRASQDWAWWDANKARLKEIAYRNLALTQKPDGLTSVFQSPRSQSNSLGYLMDNCEGYRGLRDFAAILRDRGEISEANYYDLVATGIVNGISATMYDTARSGFKVSDGDTAATRSFFAGTTCQVFPQAFGLNELSAYFDKGWNYLNKYSPNWQDGRYDAYPWAVLGFVASKRGQVSQAQAQMRTIENKFATKRALVTINELGFYQRTKSVLAGRPDI